MNIKYIKTTDNKKYDLRDKRITDTDTGVATQSANGLLSSGDKKKLDGIASGAEVNQNAFSNIKIGNTTISADGKTDTVELTAGNNITLTPDATNDKITIAATDTNTTYTFKGGTNQFTVTPSNGTAQTVSVTPSIANNVTGSDLTANTIILGNGNSGVKKSGKTIVTTLGSDDTTVPTSKAVKAAIDALPEPMIFKGTLGTGGTITSLPTAAASNEGYTYKVITDGKYAQQSAKAGDVFISNGSSWNLIPSGDEPSGTVTNVATGTGLTGGPITSSGTISHADTSSQASVSNSGRTYIQSITLDGMGHVTGITSATETVTNTDTKVTQRLYNGDGFMPLLFATEQSHYPEDITNIVYRNDSICARPSDGYIFANRFIGSFQGTLYGSASVAHQLENTTSVGSETQPVYFKQGVPTACSYQLNKTVPSDAVFTDTTYSSKSEANGGTDVSLVTTGEKYTWNNKQNKVGKLGSATKPVYISSNGTFTECSTYAGGTAVTLNEGSKAGSTASFYAPTYNGEIGQFLMSTGSSIYPAWTFLDKTYLPSDTVYGTGLTAGRIVVGDGDSKVKTSGFTIGKSVPSDAVFTDTHYTTHLYAGSGTAANAATTNGNTKLTVVDNTTTRNSVTIKGTGGTTVTSDANGVVTIDSVNKNSKWFNFNAPSKVDNALYFIISPIGTSTATGSGTCYSIEINAVVQSSPGTYIVSNAKFVTWCYWYTDTAGIRITYPVYSNSRIPIYYHNKAEGIGIGKETGSSRICNIPIKVENVESLPAVNIKVEGPGVSECVYSRSYSSFNWGQDEPTSWSSI